MPHQCIRCGKEYPDGSKTLLTGCSCGSRFFFFFKEKTPERFLELGKEERKEIFKDVNEMLGPKAGEGPVIFDLENIRVLKPGKFEIDLVSLFRRKPVIYKISEGKYMIDLVSTFQLMKKK